MRYLLDTCTFIWLTQEPRKLSKKVQKIINAEESELYLSDVNCMEICLKWKSQKLTLPQPPRLWFEEQIKQWLLKILSINRNHMYRLTELPPCHKDPFDRLLVSQCIEENFSILSPDAIFNEYPVAITW